MPKTYDQAYFDHWYRDPRTAVIDDAKRLTRAGAVLCNADWLARGEIQSVVDIGCGEGGWGVALQSLRPTLRYVGIDSSRYAIDTFGAARGLLYGQFDALPIAAVAGAIDLVLCIDVLHYVEDSTLERGLATLSEFGSKLLYLDMIEGDTWFRGDAVGFVRRSADWYRRACAQAGWIPAGGGFFRRRGVD